jgi:hypothetical protein
MNKTTLYNGRSNPISAFPKHKLNITDLTSINTTIDKGKILSLLKTKPKPVRIPANLKQKIKEANRTMDTESNKQHFQLKQENKRFSIDYKKQKKLMIKRNNETDTFKDLVKIYKHKGYKIPSLSVKHNLFSMCPLIEENKLRLNQGFLFDSTKKLARKTKKYLFKLNNIVSDKLHLDNEDIIHDKYSRRMQYLYSIYNNTDANQENINEDDETPEELLKNIKQLTKLCEECLIDQIDNLFNRDKTLRNYTMTGNYQCHRIPTRQPTQKLRIGSEKKKQTVDFNYYNNSYNNYIINNPSNSVHKSRNTKRNNFFICSPIRNPKLTEDTNSNIYRTTYNNTSIGGNSISNNVDNYKCKYFHPPTNIKYQSPIRQTPKHSSRKELSFISFNTPKRKNTTISTNFFSTQNSNYVNVSKIRKGPANLVEYAYNKCLSEDYALARDALILFLHQYKHLSLNETEDIIDGTSNNRSSVESNELLKDLSKIKAIMEYNRINKKTRNIYLNSQRLNKIRPLLQKLDNVDKNLYNMDKKLMRGIASK